MLDHAYNSFILLPGPAIIFTSCIATPLLSAYPISKFVVKLIETKGMETILIIDAVVY